MDNPSAKNHIPVSNFELRLFLTYLILAFAFAAFLRRLTELEIIQGASVASWSVCMAIFLPPAGLLIYKLKSPLSWFGISKDGLFNSIRNSIILCLFLSVLLALFPSIKTVLGSNEVSDWSFSSYYSLKAIEGAAFYLLMSFLQELLSRGLMQSYLQKILDDSKGYLSNFLNTLVFTTLHSHENLRTVVAVFCFSILLGEMYRRDRNLAGVTLFHFFLGTVAEHFGML